MRNLKRAAVSVLIAALLGMCLPVNALASSKAKTIPSVSLRVGLDIESGDRLPDINTSEASGTYCVSNNERYDIDDVEWITSDSKDMTIGEEPKMRVTLGANYVGEDEYTFKGTYRDSNVKITGGTFISASRKDGGSQLVVTLRVKAIKGKYEAPDEAYWKDSGIGSARWSQVEDSSETYDVFLYRGNSVVKKVEGIKATSYNFYPYMTKEGTYSFKVRTVPRTETEKKYGKNSDWTESDEYYLAKEKVSDGSGQEDGNSPGNTGQVGWIKDNESWYYKYPDGTYLKNTWSRISDKWYLFDGTGVMLTGWQQKNSLWYYLNSPSGEMCTGWRKNGDKWYYLNPSTTEGVEGAMKTGWIHHNDRWYYTDRTGVMVEGWYQVDGNWYYFYPGEGSKAVSTTIDTFPVDANGIWHRP